MDMLPIRRAILSVTDKTDLVDFAHFLDGFSVELISTGGTYQVLAQAGLKVRPVSELTGFPEILDGRVKTLHPHIHAGILASKDNPRHMQTLQDRGLAPFDLVCVNLYNFSKAVHQGLADTDAVEQIDIRGPTMLRAAAKNFYSIAVCPDPTLYSQVMQEMKKYNGSLTLAFRKRMAVTTFKATADYDSMIAKYLAGSDHIA